MKITFSKSALPKTGAYIVPCFDEGGYGAAFAEVDALSEGAIAHASKSASFSARSDQFVELIAPQGLTASRVLLCGLGKRSDFTLQKAEEAAGKAIARLLKTKEKSAAFVFGDCFSEEDEAEETAARLALGAVLRSYRFDKYRTTLEKDQKPTLTKLSIHGAPTGAKKIFTDLEKVSEGVFLARDLVSEPANILYPESFAERCKELEELGVKVKVLGEKEMTKLGMGSLLGVGQGSDRESKLVAMEWNGGKQGQEPVAFVGKGVTFDTGGISLKPPAGMEDMKWDMGGAAAVTGAMAAIAGRGAKVNVVGVIGLVENMPDGLAQRPGDVVTSMAGKTIEVINTDAEGRLVLADAIWWTQETYKPKAVVDLATLTGAIIISLANEYAGLFTPDDELAAQLLDAGEESGDNLWRMPLSKAHYSMIKSDIADMKNVGGRGGGSSTAAAFIGNFIKQDQAWAHLDIAGMAWSNKDKPVTPKGGVGFGVRLLDAFVRKNYEA